MSKIAYATLAVAFASGCALKASQERDELRTQALPNLSVPAQWVEKGGAAGAVANGWLAAFNDPRLDALVLEAIANNPDLRVAAARVEQAAGYVKVAGATLYPQVNLLARGGGKMSGDSSGLEGVGVFASWELDLWGRVRAGREAAQLQYLSAELDAEYARQSIAALVAKSWFLATEARLQKSAAEDMVRSAERLIELARDRQRVGKGDEYDVTLAQASLQTYRDAVQQIVQGSLVPQLPDILASLAFARHSTGNAAAYDHACAGFSGGRYRGLMLTLEG